MRFFAIPYIIEVKKVKNSKKAGVYMEVAKLSSKGQITIPISVRNRLKLKTGDKVVILEENGRFYLENSAMMAFSRVADSFEGEAENAGFQTEEEMQDYMKTIRQEIRGY